MRTYKIQYGDTFSKIVQKTGISAYDLKNLNPQIKNINRIVIDQIVNLPDIITSISVPNKEKDFDITVEQLCGIVPKLTPVRANQIIGALNLAMREFSIDTSVRKTAFLAQIAHETGGFNWLCELGNNDYFKKYDGRKDLGNINPGDGARFKGRGFIQITGRTNYLNVGTFLKLDLLNNPNLAEDPGIAARIAGWFWSSRKLNELADKDDIVGITRRINGGLNGLVERKEYWMRAKNILG